MPSQSEPHRSTKSTVKPTAELYRVEEILQERKGEKVREILVRWAGIDERTGREWPLEWIPKSWASLQTRLLWEKEKAVIATLKPSLVTPSRPNSSNTLDFLPDQPDSRAAYVEVPVDRDFPKEDYPVIAAATSQASQSSSEPSRDTASWAEGTQQSLLASSQASTFQPQSSLASYPPSGFGSQPRLPSQPSPSEAPGSTEQRLAKLTSDRDGLVSPYISLSAPIVSTDSIPASSSSLLVSSAQPRTIYDSNSGPSLDTLLQTQVQSQPATDFPVDNGGITSIPTSPTAFYTPQPRFDRVRESSVLSTQFSLPTSQRRPQERAQSSLGNFQSQISNESPRHSPQPAEKEPNYTPNLCHRSNPTTCHSQPVSGASLQSSPADTAAPRMSSMLNGNSKVSPPMQDRVRSIRNSALSAQNRRGNNEDHSPMSSRSTSLAPESSKQRGVSESRQDSRLPEVAGQPQIDELFPEAEDDSDDSITSNVELTLPVNGENMEFFLALPLPSRVKSQYEATIKYFKKSMGSFLSDNTDNETVQSMRRLVQRLNNVSTHVDLENEEWEKTQSELAEDQTKWALSSGSKFVFLHSLCNMLRDQSVHIAVVAKQPRVLYILERVMQGIQIDYVRPDSGKRTTPGNSQSRLKVSLIATGNQAQLGPWTSTNLVVAFDRFFDSNERHIRTLRANSPSLGGLAPVVHPMVYCSAEHLGRCIDEMEGLKSELDRLRALIVAIEERQAEIGEMTPEDFRPDAAGEEVGHFVLNGGGKNNWTVLPVRPVKVIGLEILLQDEFSPALAAEQAQGRLISSPNSRKRPSEDDLDEESEVQKRQRMSPTADVTHVSESTLASQNAQIAELRQAFEATRQAAEQASTARVNRLQSVLAEREESLTEQGKALEDLQTRYEKTKRAFRKLQTEKDDLAGQIERANRRHETTTTTIDQLREANKKAVTDLEAARAELANSTVPEVSQLEQLRVENRKLMTDKGALEKKVQSMSHDFEFTRQQYQHASSAAAEHWSKVQDLEQENTGLRQRASGEAVRLRELTNRSEVETHVGENTRLKAENEELKEQLKRKERGRGMTTRTGSVAPRSPRLGGSPGRSRAGSRAPGSRPQSPVRNFYGVRRGRGLVEQSL